MRIAKKSFSSAVPTVKMFIDGQFVGNYMTLMIMN